MKKRTEQILLTASFCAFLLGMMVLYLILPKQEFSRQEKRYLAQQPEVSWDAVASGAFSDDLDTYLADHIPGRNFFVGLNAYFELFTGRQKAGDILLTDNRLVEAPVEPKAGTLEKNMGIFNTFAQKNGVQLDFMLVPSGGWAAQESGAALPRQYLDTELIKTAYEMAGENVRTVDLVGAFRETEAAQELYYRTDHHWTSAGAYAAYSCYMETLGRDYPRQSDYRIETVADFYGSTYTRSALWLTPGEELELWHSPSAITVTHEESVAPNEGVFFRERLEEMDKYTVFLDGNHSCVRLENPDNTGKGKLLVIRDSFSNCLGGFLADSYETVTLVDLRYYRQPVSELIAQEQFDQILVCYSIHNFLTDTNMIWLR